MKRTLTIIGTGLAIATVALTSCRTNEATYRKAYEGTKARLEQTGGIDSTVYAKIRQQARPSTVAVGNDTVPLVSHNIYLTKDQPNAQLKRYNVAVAQFKQIFNARAMCQRLYDAGFVNSYIVETTEPLYYVVAEGADHLEQAAGLLDKFRQHPPFPIRDPFPYIMQSAKHAR